MEPSFLLSYWRPWDEESSFVDSWGDYIRDKSMAEFSAGLIGAHIQRASREQVNAIQEASLQQTNAIEMQTRSLEEMGMAQIEAINNAAQSIGFRISEVQKELSFLNRKMDISLEQQRLGLILQDNIAQLLKIPDSEKERQQAITLGIQFFVNASKDPDLFDDALDFFLKAEQLKKQDYFVLHRIGCIYLYSPKHLNPQLALDYFLRAAKYASVESSPDALRLVNILTNPINAEYTNQTSDPKQIMLLAANSYEKAALSSYIIGDDERAAYLQEKALSFNQIAINSFNLAKYLIRSGNISQAMYRLEWAIDEDATMIEAAICDADIAYEPKTIQLLNKKNSELDNCLEEAILDSFTSRTTRHTEIEKLCYSGIATLPENLSYVKKKEAFSSFLNDRSLSNLNRLEKNITSIVNSFKLLEGFLPKKDIDNWIALLSVDKMKSIEECHNICQKAKTYLQTIKLKVGDIIHGGTIIRIDEDGKKGLMCAESKIGPMTFSKSSLKESFISVLTKEDGMDNTQLLLSKASFPAANACKTCRIGGYNDWYLPSREEIKAFVRKTRADELNNKRIESFRNRQKVSDIWTSSGITYDEYVGGRHIWGVCFFDLTAQVQYETTSSVASEEHYVLPVRKFCLDF